jgi:hypothetical protein
MGTLLRFSSSPRKAPRPQTPEARVAEVVIFPGVRIERHDLDLSHRLRDPEVPPNVTGSRRPKRTS